MDALTLLYLLGLFVFIPAGAFGFGDAAQRIMQRPRVSPTASDGQPSPGACTRRRVNFRLADN